jgi:hypothetical protein
MATIRSARLASQRRKALAWLGVIGAARRLVAATLGAVALGMAV